MVAGSINLYLTNAVILAYIVLIIVRNKLSIGALIGKIPPGYNWWPIVFMAVGGLAYSLGAIAVVMYPLAQFDRELVKDIYSENVISESHTSFFILTVILAPLIEETVFRGLLFSRLTKKWGMTTAMVVSSLAFALLHLNPIGSFVFGIVACVFYSRTGTLLVPMVFHALNNFIVWILMFSGGDAGSPGIDLGSPELLGQFAYAGLIAMTFGAPIVFIFMGKWWPSRETPTPYEVNIVNNRISS
jgi:membrane protease YdiL (CAAX protease family)